MLNNTKPHLQSIKRKLGASNEFYFKISTQIVNNALSNVITEVNKAQAVIDNDNKFTPIFSGNSYLFIDLKIALRKAWEAIKLMDGFDMEYNYKNNRYNENRSILKGLCEVLEVSTSTYTPRTSSPTTTTRTTTSTNSSKSNTKGYVLSIFAIVAIIIGIVIAGCMGSKTGVFVGILIISGLLGYICSD